MSNQEQSTKKAQNKFEEFQQNDKLYQILISTKENNIVFSILSNEKIDKIYNLSLSTEDLKSLNKMFKIYDTTDELVEFLRSLKTDNKISVEEKEDKIILHLEFFNLKGENQKLFLELSPEEIGQDDFINSLKINVSNLNKENNKLKAKVKHLEQELNSIKEAFQNFQQEYASFKEKFN